jgi:hypothetical protein
MLDLSSLPLRSKIWGRFGLPCWLVEDSSCPELLVCIVGATDEHQPARHGRSAVGGVALYIPCPWTFAYTRQASILHTLDVKQAQGPRGFPVVEA